MIRVLVIGCGQIALAGHLPALRKLADEGLVKLVACDVDGSKARAAADRFGAQAASDWEQAAAEVDAAVVCTPPGPNAAIAAAAVERGLHVLCEKPPGRDVADAVLMAEAAARRPDVVTMIGFNRRFTPMYREAMARSVRLGPPQSFYGRFSRASLALPPSNTARDWITADSCHTLDLAVAAAGFPRSVSVARQRAGAGPERCWTLHLDSEGASAVLFFHYGAGRRLERYEWAGPGYDVALEIPGDAQWAVQGQAVEALTGPSEYADQMGFVAEHRAFVDAIAGTGPRPEADFAHGERFMRLVGAVLEAEPATSVAIAGPPPVETTKPAALVAGSGRTGPARPTVVLHQGPAAQARLFSMDTFSDLSRRCDVRPWSPGTDAHVVVTGRGSSAMPAESFEADGLGLVVVIGASVRAVPFDRLAARGVAVCNTAHAVAQIVAEHCLLLTLAGLRRLPQMDAAMHRGAWPSPSSPVAGRTDLRALARRLPIPQPVKASLKDLERWVRKGPAGGVVSAAGPGGGGSSLLSDLRGEVVGLAGWGHTARCFAELLQPLGCEILVATGAGRVEELAAVGARPAPLGEVLAASKVVSLHAGLTDRTRGMIGRAELERMRPGAVLVNTARGGLIDEDALVDRLRTGHLIAALDVYEEEPLPKGHPLRKLPNAILTPHCASTTAQEERRIGEAALDLVRRWLDGEPVPSLTPDRVSRMT